jgi:hypothetical protein
MNKNKIMLGAFGVVVLGAGIWGLCALWSHFGPSRVPINWSFVTAQPKMYRAGYDKVANSQTPTSLVIRSLNSSAEGFAGLSQKCDATPYRGQRVRISVWIKTDGVNGSAQFSFSVKDQAGARLVQGGDGVGGSRYWRQYAAVVDVPEEAATLSYGMTLSGAGKAWFNDLQIDVVPNTVKLDQWQLPDLSAMPRLKLGSLLAADPEEALKSLVSPKKADVSLEESGAEGRVLKFDLMGGKPGFISSMTNAEDYAGKKLRLRARLKTADLQGGRVTIFFNTQSQNTDDSFAAWSKLISGTTDWKDYDCVIPISGQKAMVMAGMSAQGKSGSVFLKSLEVSLADDSPPGGEGFEVMQMTWPESPVLATPMNLDFSK